MSFAKYVGDRLPELAIGICALLMCCGVAFLTGAAFDAVVLVGIVLLLTHILALAVGYARRRKFFEECVDAASQLEHVRQLYAYIEEPDLAEQRAYYDVMERIGRSAADDLDEAERHSRAYREYVESWIHEVKAPIAAARLTAERLDGEDATQMRNELERIEANVEQALWYARSTALEADYSIHEVELEKIVRSVCRKNARLLIDRCVSLQFTGLDGVKVFTDEKWAAFIIAQAVVNAAKYGARELSFATVKPDGHAEGKRVVLQIADDGAGIPACDVPRVFDRGFTGANGRKAGSSTGMGLYLAAIMCEKMGLGLKVASEEGTGTRVLIAFPLDRERLDFVRAQA